MFSAQQINLQNNLNTANLLRHNYPAIILATSVSADGVLLRTSVDSLRAVALLVRNTSWLQQRSLVDIAATDRLLPNGRFLVTFIFRSLPVNHALLIQL
jgi:hypothetical protein